MSDPTKSYKLELDRMSDRSIVKYFGMLAQADKKKADSSGQPRNVVVSNSKLDERDFRLDDNWDSMPEEGELSFDLVVTEGNRRLNGMFDVSGLCWAGRPLLADVIDKKLFDNLLKLLINTSSDAERLSVLSLAAEEFYFVAAQLGFVVRAFVYESDQVTPAHSPNQQTNRAFMTGDCRRQNVSSNS